MTATISSMVSDVEVVEYARKKGYSIYDFEALRFALTAIKETNND